MLVINAPVAQRKSRCLLSTGSGYRNSVGALAMAYLVCSIQMQLAAVWLDSIPLLLHSVCLEGIQMNVFYI